MNFKKGNIIEFCKELYEVEENHGHYGTVWEVNDRLERTGSRIEKFYWSFWGENCKLIEVRV